MYLALVLLLILCYLILSNARKITRFFSNAVILFQAVCFVLFCSIANAAIRGNEVFSWGY